jgi:hypothetical protein
MRVTEIENDNRGTGLWYSRLSGGFSYLWQLFEACEGFQMQANPCSASIATVKCHHALLQVAQRPSDKSLL